MTGLSWVATEALTGELIADLPLLEVDKVKSVIGRYDSVQASLPVPEAPENWERATLHGATNMILLADNPNDPAHGIPLWGGMVKPRRRTHQDKITMTLATIESYLDGRYVGDETFTGVGQNTILATLLTNYVLTGPNGGIPLRIAYSGAGTLRDRTYQDQNNMTVYSAFQNFMGVIDGPEWTIGWEWQTSPERLTPVCYISTRIGSAVTAGLGPNATFEMPGPVTEFEFTEDYSQGKGATTVVASSSGTTSARPQSTPQSIADPDRPTFEYRFTPSTSITDTDTLDSYAGTAATALAGGTNAITLSATVEDGPRLGIDWFIGDDIGYQIGGLDSDGNETVPSFPGGKSGIARAVGWEMSLGNTPIITPIFTSSSL